MSEVLSRSLSLPSLSRLIYSVRSRVHDVGAMVNFHQSERVYHILRSVECMECNFPHIESNQNGGRCGRFRFSRAKLICLLLHASFLTRIVIGFSYTKGCSDVMNTTSHRVYQTREGGKRKGPRTTSDV